MSWLLIVISCISIRESNSPLKTVWVGGVQINGLVHKETEENYIDPSLKKSKSNLMNIQE